MLMDDPCIASMIAAGQLFHQRGWVPASAGNFSARLESGEIAITSSGRHKGELQPADFMTVDLAGAAQDPQRRSSAETLLHCQIYRCFPETAAIFHSHSVAATVLSRQHRRLVLKDYELLKILDGIDSHAATVQIPVFDNDQDIARLAGEVDAEMEQGGARHGYLIRGHGLYAWADDVATARYRVEALECLFECLLAEQGVAR